MFGRLRCHFCGARSAYSKGTTEFQCTGCEALNFFDPKGEVAEPPHSITDPPQQQQPQQQTTARSTSPFESLSRPSSQDQQQQQIFCQRCLNNQRTYMDALNSYLPDDDHPLYQEYIDKLPQKKADLEKKYPQVCKTCAPKVQEKIHQADYQGMSQQAAIAMSRTRARRGQSPLGQRDDWGKWLMRTLLSLCGLLVYGSLLAQAIWHVYGLSLSIFGVTVPDEFQATMLDETDSIPHIFAPTYRSCLQQSRLLQFDPLCHDLFRTIVTKALVMSFLLLWYNPGLKQWYHDTYRIEAIHGQIEYFRIQVLLLLGRVFAWAQLRDTYLTADLSKQQLIAFHGFMIAVPFFVQWLSETRIEAERWKIRGRIMPRPSEQDVFGATAGPADEQYTRQASSIPPLRLFARDDRPFPIEALAPNPRNTRGYSKLELPRMPPPSPPFSDDDDDDTVNSAEGMDLDPPRSRTDGMPGKPIDRTFRPKNHGGTGRPQTRSLYNHGTTQPMGWGAMRSAIFGMQDQMRVDEERKRAEEEEEKARKLRYSPPTVEPSPFRGRLPPAPMSMGKRLRNPPTQVSFKQTPLSEQQDFMKQMRESFENGRIFGPGGAGRKSVESSVSKGYDDDDEDFSPTKSRTRGNLDLKPSSWHLPGDGEQTTGLEDLLGGRSFAIADEVDVGRPAQESPQVKGSGLMWTSMVFGILACAAVWNVQAIRRPLCLWLVRKMEEIGI